MSLPPRNRGVCRPLALLALALLLACEGPTGPEGPQGQSGQQGEQGDQGPQGPAGPTVGAVVQSSYDNGPVNVTGTATTLRTVSISIPGPGTILVFANTESWCAAGCTGESVAVKVTNSSGDAVTTGPWAYTILADQTPTSVSRMRSFSVLIPGTYTYYLRARSPSSGSIPMYRSELYAVFLPAGS